MASNNHNSSKAPVVKKSEESTSENQESNMVDTAEAEQLIRQGLGKRKVRSDGQVGGNSQTNSGDSDMLSNGFHGYEKLTQSAISQKIKKFANRTLAPLILIPAATCQVVCIWYTIAHCGGSYLKFFSVFSDRSLLGGLKEIWSVFNYPSLPIISILVAYIVYALIMMKILPGPIVKGPLTPKGNTPIYKDNGFLHYIITIGIFWVLTVVLHPYGISPSILYDRFDEVIIVLNVFSILLCIFLYLKGMFRPSSTDSGSSGNILFDYYWGMELYPQVFGIDIKVFTNCRFGMTVWPLLVCVHAVKSFELYGFVDSMFVSAVLQLLYFTKFFMWESGYMNTIDIMLDRAGFYICWGCLVFVPGLYASVTFYLVGHPVHLGPILMCLLLVLGISSLCINYAADCQKQEVRGANGNCLIWGRKPDIIRAKYQLENGNVKESILLVSGWWGLSRHFHYIPEILLALFWSLPAQFDNLMPYTYVIWLCGLLVHRSYRDDSKCGQKYGTFWQQYCKKVPHKIVPYIF